MRSVSSLSTSTLLRLQPLHTNQSKAEGNVVVLCNPLTLQFNVFPIFQEFGLKENHVVVCDLLHLPTSKGLKLKTNF
ncbi:CLUMA_CG003877, isoform A [Clunio marinus]|uniref:CLUMA_CG003877, isoform A n=1 Tax=Clunio marinus TaxID=568069 RepID=A0A1J1HRK8_9DIPT|nr:CLUMA_CG003877, isoform A [Clunio marinus]